MTRFAGWVAAAALLVLPLIAQAEERPEHGIAAVYAAKLIGHRTANGETLDRTHLTAAHRRLPFGALIEVTNTRNGRKVVLRVNDRGPYRKGFILDLSPAAAERLGINRRSTAPVVVRLASVPR